MNCLRGIIIILAVVELIITLLKENALEAILFAKQLTKSKSLISPGWWYAVGANHTTAGDYRSEDGFTPDLHREGGVFFCKTKNQSARVHYPGFPSEINGNGSLVLKDGDLVVYHWGD